jgi:hypothetical protein
MAYFLGVVIGVRRVKFHVNPGTCNFFPALFEVSHGNHFLAFPANWLILENCIYNKKVNVNYPHDRPLQSIRL